MKKFLSITLILTLFITLGTTGYCKPIEDIDTSIGTLELGECPYYGIHQMYVQIPYADVFDNLSELDVGPYNWYINGGGIYKCDCGEIVICTGRPHISGWSLGEYYRGDEVQKIRGGEFCGDNDIPSVAGYISFYSDYAPNENYDDSYLPGYRFYESH